MWTGNQDNKTNNTLKKKLHKVHNLVYSEHKMSELEVTRVWFPTKEAHGSVPCFDPCLAVSAAGTRQLVWLHGRLPAKQVKINV